MVAFGRHGSDRDRQFIAPDFLAGIAVADPVFAITGVAESGVCVLAKLGNFDAGHRRWLFFDVVGTKKIRHGHVVMKIDSVD